MKTYNLTNKISLEAKKEIERVISTHETYSNSYFFTPPTSAGCRRSQENKFAISNPDVEFITKKGVIKVTMSLRNTCSNVYYKISITLDGVAKNITTIKNLLK